jgi:hypothetical protein
MNSTDLCPKCENPLTFVGTTLFKCNVCVKEFNLSIVESPVEDENGDETDEIEMLRVFVEKRGFKFTAEEVAEMRAKENMPPWPVQCRNCDRWLVQVPSPDTYRADCPYCKAEYVAKGKQWVEAEIAPTPTPTPAPTPTSAPTPTPTPTPTPAPPPAPPTPALPTTKKLAGEAWDMCGGFNLDALKTLVAGKPWSEEDKARMLAETIKAYPAFTDETEDKTEDEEGEEGEPTEDPDLLDIPKLPGYQVDKWCRPWGMAKRGRAAGPLTPTVYFRYKKVKGKTVKWFICRYKVTVDGEQRGFTAKYFQQARFFAVQKRKGKVAGPDVDTYDENESS